LIVPDTLGLQGFRITSFAQHLLRGHCYVSGPTAHFFEGNREDVNSPFEGGREAANSPFEGGRGDVSKGAFFRLLICSLMVCCSFIFYKIIFLTSFFHPL